MESTVQYAGFWRRLGAGLLDSLILLPVFFLLFPHPLNATRGGALACLLLSQLLCQGYKIYLHAKFGQTLGKMATKIKLVKLDLAAVSWKESLIRNAPDLLLSLLFFIGAAISYSQSTDAEVVAAQIYPSAFLSIDIEKIKLISEAQKIIHDRDPLAMIAGVLSNLWFWSEFIVLLFNKKKRAIHDFIAGTVVIRK